MLENHFEIVLGNLVRNSIQYSETGNIDIYLNENSITVKDQGQGISSEHIGHIKERFYHDPKSIGHGIGLYLVANICKYYNLELEVNSVVDEGLKCPYHVISGFIFNTSI